MIHVLVASLIMLVQVPAECRHEDARSAQLNGGRTLRIEAGSGELRVEGRAGVSGVRVEARLCASSQELLAEMELETAVHDGTAVVRTELPDHSWNNSYARMDLLIIVPEGMAADIEDGSGAMWLNGLGDARVIDGSGSIEIDNVRGTLVLEDGSGSAEIANVAGDVRIEDGSGNLALRGIHGTVDIDDGSGGIEIVDARRNVRIDDGSGSITARRIGGDFTVDDDGSGSIRHSEVAGTVRIPRDKRAPDRD